MGGSIGKTLNGHLVLKLAALQVGGLKEYFFSIGRDMTAKSLEDSFSWIGIVH